MSAPGGRDLENEQLRSALLIKRRDQAPFSPRPRGASSTGPTLIKARPRAAIEPRDGAFPPLAKRGLALRRERSKNRQRQKTQQIFPAEGSMKAAAC